MEIGPLGQLLLDLRARIDGADSVQRIDLAMKWARRALHVHLTAALAHRGQSSPSLSGWLGPIESVADRATALSRVQSLLAGLPERASDKPIESGEERDQVAARLALGLAKTILECLQPDIDAATFRRLAWAAQILAQRAQCYEEEQRQMLAEAGGPPDG